MVKTTDFDYFETLGKGSFGIVMRCRKKSTKQFYAMKIIAKTELLHACRHDLHSVDVEVRALASLRHPFIIGMDYSFQNSQYAFIVMELAEGGTLASVLKCFRKQVLTEPHIRFYVAEIAEALHYLHGLGILYQDLKLANVLIHTDGHVKLADLGGVVDLGGDVISTNKNSEGQITSQSPLAAWAEPSLAATFKSSHLSNPRRNHSVYGTRGYSFTFLYYNPGISLIKHLLYSYMAPEVLELLVPNRVNCRGSAYMADWWSLGIVAYILLTGERPFNVPKHCSAEEELLHIRAGHLSFPESTSPGCVEFICSLLEEDDTKRLGFGVDGFNDIMNHPFFESFKWSKVITKMCRPPYVPSEMDVLYDPDQVEKPLYDGFDSLPMFDQDARAPSTKDKNLFKDWYT